MKSATLAAIIILSLTSCTSSEQSGSRDADDGAIQSAPRGDQLDADVVEVVQSTTRNGREGGAISDRPMDLRTMFESPSGRDAGGGSSTTVSTRGGQGIVYVAIAAPTCIDPTSAQLWRSDSDLFALFTRDAADRSTVCEDGRTLTYVQFEVSSHSVEGISRIQGHPPISVLDET